MPGRASARCRRVLDIIGKRRYGYIFSLVLTGLGLLFILATFIPNAGIGLQFSIAYTGGTVWEVHFQDGTPDPAVVRTVLDELGHPGSDVAITGDADREYVLIRTSALTLVDPTLAEGSAAAALASASPSAGAPASGTPAASTASASSAVPSPSPAPGSSAPPVAVSEDGPVAGVPTEGEFGALATALQDRFGLIDEVRQQDSVGAVVSSELIQQTILLIAMASLGIMAWISYRFRDFRMGVTALVALVHDVIVTVGIFALLGTFIGMQIDALFVTAILTVIGFSVHDTIVVFDRVRENRGRYVGEPLEPVINHSVNQTLGRSITTSLTIILTLFALFVFAGEAIRPFTLALLIGVSAGTYSSILVAVPLFLDWHLWDDRRKARQPQVARPSPA
jgi:preprotein translocase SecF subunit